MAEIIWLFGKDGKKIMSDHGRAEAAREFARNAELRDASAKAATLRPYKTQPTLDARLCVALHVHGQYLVLQFNEGVTPHSLAHAAAADVWHVAPHNFAQRFKMLRQVPVSGALYDQLHRHIFSGPTGISRTALFCAQKISAVYEATKAGTWEPEEEKTYTVDETGWRPINRQIVLAKGDLLIQYEGGVFAHGPAAQMRKRLQSATPPAPKP